MKTTIICLIVNAVFLLFPVSSRGKQVPVRLKVGEQLIYEWTEREVPTDKSSFISDQLKTIRYSVLIDKIENNKVFFTIQTLQNRTETQGNGATSSADQGFPQLVNNFWVIPNADIVNETLHQKKFQYELDLNNRTILLTNGPELLGQCESSLAAKGYSAEFRLKIINEIKTGLQKQPLLEPFMFVNSNIDQPIIHQQDLGLTFTSTKRNVEQLELSSAPDSLNQSCKCILNLQFGLVTSFSKNSIEKTNPNHRFSPDSRLQICQQFKLLQKSFPKQPKVIVSGHIENPVSDQVVVYTLNKFIGTDLDSKMVYLDKAGNFRIEAKLENKGLVLVTNPNKKQNIPGPVILLYAEPGDSLYLDTRLALKQFQERILIPRDSTSLVKKDYIIPEAISFSGDRKMEAELLNNFRQQMGVSPFQITDNKLDESGSRTNAKIYLKALNVLEKLIIIARKNAMGKSTVYLEHELQAYLYSRLFEAQPADLGKGQWISNFPVITNDIKDQVQAKLDTFNINRIYNDYGLFSRSLTSPYVRYKYNQLVPMSKRIQSSIQFSWIYDFELNLQFYKLVLSGSPLYHEMADQLCNYSFGSALSYDNLKAWRPTIDETFELMIKRCNDEVFVNALIELRNSQLNWNDLRFIPEPGFLNLQKQPATLRSFITEKPSIVYSSDNWSVGRYEMDELAPKYAEISFILINDGSNYEIWKSWNDRAEPKAHQLFLINGSLRLKDIF